MANYDFNSFSVGEDNYVIKVKADNIEDNSITANKIMDFSITNTKIQDGIITNSKIENGAISDDKLNSDGILRQVADLNDYVSKIDIAIDPDDLSLEQDPDTNYVYPVYRGVRSENGIPLSAGGGGGGSGSSSGNNAIITISNTTGWLAHTISQGSACELRFNWSSTDGDIPTGDGNLVVTINGLKKISKTISQGTVVVDVSPYLSIGTQKVKVKISDSYDNSRTLTFTITVVELRISSTFNTLTPFEANQEINYTYTPIGIAEKTVIFKIDGEQVRSVTVTTSGRQITQTLPGLSHGAHMLTVYFTAVIDGQEVTSNVLQHALMIIDPNSRVPIIASAFAETTVKQYQTFIIPYIVYTPNSLFSNVTLSINHEVVSSQTVDRTQQMWNVRLDGIGTHVLTIASGTESKDFVINVSESDVQAAAETDSLMLHLSSYGRSNNEPHPEVWKDADNNIDCVLNNFNFISDGWVIDSDGITTLRVAGGATVTIPYKPFAQDFRITGKTIEIDFSTRDVRNYEAVILSCMNGGRGLEVTSQRARLVSEQVEISAQYKEDEHVRISFVVEKRSQANLIYIYINGVASGVVQYADNDDFSQPDPVDLTIGGRDCTIDIYRIRIYDNSLTRYQILNNWIADTMDASVMLERYSHNNVYDEYGKIAIDKLPDDLPYMIITCEQLPQYKGDKKTCSGRYIDPIDGTNSFEFEGCQINVQGTSSAPYARKNYDMQFKKGFDMLESGHADNFALASNIIPFNRFVLKADVASSESANNVELVKLFCEATPYKRREQIANPKVRQGIYGFPIVVFWENPSDNTVSFLGKYNFNLPKRAPGPYGYSGEMESWEFQNNTSTLMLFKTDYFDNTKQVDPTTGDSKELWRYDYEARFPSDEWINYNKLQELQTFVVSTYRELATGDALSVPVTYGVGDNAVTYTNDTADYRLAKFKYEFGNYAELNSFIFYYIFTELFLMVDSRAKNLFIGFSGSDTTGLTYIDRKAVAEPYDMDTAIGTNNEGSLVFDYSLEDTDTVDGANVFNGQDSVLWNNLRDAFSIEIDTMYKTLRSEGILSYPVVEKRFEDHQAKWPEAIFNEDSWFKYIDPLLSPDPGKEPTAVYLPMMQGSKAEQRKWWLYNRFRYLDSKWSAGDALNDRISLRTYTRANTTITPYADIYPTIQFGSYFASKRGKRGVATTLVCPLPPGSTLNDTETYIYSAPQLADVGDLSPLKVGFADFSAATKLQSIKIGDSDPEYNNPNIRTLTVGTNTLLSTVDARNCSNLTGAVDLSGASNIEHVRFAGTIITSVILPVGGILKELELPETITNLTVRNQRAVTSFTMPNYNNITTLRVENSPGIPVEDILDVIPQQSRVRLIGLYRAIGTKEEAKHFFDNLQTMRGLDEFDLDTTIGNAVSGTVIVSDTVTGEWLESIYENFPNIDIQADHMTVDLNYYTYNGSEWVKSYTETITDGGNGTYAATPAREATDQYSYTFAGWSMTPDGDADSAAMQNVTRNRNIYAAYTKTVRKYTVTWKNIDGTVLKTDVNIAYGTVKKYSGPTPSYQGRLSTGWTPSVGPITGDTIYTATYVPVYTVYFKNDNVTMSQIMVPEGQNAPLPATNPTFPGAPQDYIFVGWDSDGKNIRSTTYIYALYYEVDPLIPYVQKTIRGINNSNISYIKEYAFQSCSNLTFVNCPNVTEIGMYGFDGCQNLKILNIPNVQKIGMKGFATIKLNSISVPNLKEIGWGCFQTCMSMTSFFGPNVTIIESYCFQQCFDLSVITLPKITKIEGEAFQYCRSLTEIHLESITSVPLLKLSAFNYTPITSYYSSVGRYGSIFVPSSLYQSFLAAPSWSDISSRIVSV